MANYKIRILREGKPLRAATVWVGEVDKRAPALTDATDDKGLVSVDTTTDGPMLVMLRVEGERFAFGGGPYLIRPDTTLDVEV